MMSGMHSVRLLFIKSRINTSELTQASRERPKQPCGFPSWLLRAADTCRVGEGLRVPRGRVSVSPPCPLCGAHSQAALVRCQRATCEQLDPPWSRTGATCHPWAPEVCPVPPTLCRKWNTHTTLPRLSMGKKKKKRHVKSPINICIYFLLKWYFKYISQIKYIIKISFPDFFFAALPWLLGSWKCGSYCPSPGHHGDSAILTRSLGPGWLLSTLLLYTLVLFCWPCVGLWVIIRSLGSDAVERAGLVGWCGWRFEGHAEEQQDRSKLSSFFFQSHLAGASSLILKPLPVGGEAQLPGHFGVEIGES